MILKKTKIEIINLLNILLILFLLSSTSVYSISGEPPKDSTTYIIIDGPGSGIQLHSGRDLSLVIEKELNPTTMAEGEILKPKAMNCPGASSHYHGILFGSKDPAPSECGWGHVVLFDKSSDFLQLITAVIMREERVFHDLSKIAPKSKKEENTRFNNITADIDNSLKQLDELISIVEKIKTDTKESDLYKLKTNILEELHTVVRLEKKTLKKLNNLEIVKIISLIDATLKLKKNIFQNILILNHLVKS